jgi:hypothetical protein
MKFKNSIIGIIIFFVAYLLGAITIMYKLPPYGLLKKSKSALSSNSTNVDYFKIPVSNTDKLRYSPVKNYDELNKRINTFKVKVDSFEIAYDRIKIVNFLIEGSILTLTYEYNGQPDTAFAYYKPSSNKTKNEVGINVIPGSGYNQSSAIFYNEKDNYQSNIDDVMEHYGDVFVYVKPNEDFLAIHNGNAKIDELSYVNYLINNGSSYSSYYMIQSMALSKFIKNNYKKLYVCGLSQGGFAALVNSLQSQPDKSIIASGYSVLLDHPYVSGFNQLIIPNINTLYTSVEIKKQIKESETKFLFTWGIKENELFGKESKEKLTSLFLEELPNVATSIHPEGHVYYEPVIKNFVEDKIFK